MQNLSLHLKIETLYMSKQKKMKCFFFAVS